MQLTAFFVGVGINLIVIILIYIRLSLKIKKGNDSSQIISEIRQEVDELVVELNQTTDRNIGLIEERIRTLSQTMEEADKRIRLLKKSTDTHTMNTATYSRIGPRVQATSRENDSPPAEDRTIDNGTPSAEESSLNKGPRTIEQSRERVKELRAQGMSSEIIASKLDFTVGEVELMITMMEGKNR